MQTKKQRGHDVPELASDQDLEKYGVWVKAEPQDVIEEPETEHELISEAEEGSLVPPADMDFASDDELSLDDFGLPEGVEDEQPAQHGGDDVLDIQTLGGDDDLAIMDVEDNLDEGVIEDSVIDIPLDELTEAPPERPSSPEPEAREPEADSSGAMEVSLEDFGFSMDEAPEETEPPSTPSAGAEAVDLSEFGMSEEEETHDEPVPADEFESIDIDLNFDDTIPAPSEPSADSSVEFSLDDVEDLSKPVFEDVGGLEGIPSPASSMEDVTAAFDDMETKSMPSGISVDSFIDSDQGGGDSVLPSLEQREGIRLDSDVGFDDVGAVTSDLASPSGGAASDMLKTIASELAAIKDELSSLRSQLGALKSSRPAEGAESDESKSAGAQSGGFFDEEEDDTIALTGDELDNILNTADFTEEAGSPDRQADLAILPEDGDYEAHPSDIEHIGIDATPAESESHELPDVDATPMTPLEEDTSYLDTEDLEEPPLVEPAADELVLDESGDDDLGELVLSIEGEEPESPPADLAEAPLEELEASELEELAPEDVSFDMNLHTEEVGIEDLSPLDEQESGESLADRIDSSVIKPATPVEVHPDEINMSLDDSFFVEAEEAPERPIELSSPPPIAMPSFGMPSAEPTAPSPAPTANDASAPEPVVSDKLKTDIKSVLLYLDQLLASLPEEKIEEFASSEYYDTYKKLFEELGLL